MDFGVAHTWLEFCLVCFGIWIYSLGSVSLSISTSNNGRSAQFVMLKVKYRKSCEDAGMIVISELTGLLFCISSGGRVVEQSSFSKCETARLMESTYTQ